MSLHVSLLTSLLTLMLIPVAILAQDTISLRQTLTVTEQEMASGSLPLERLASMQGNLSPRLRSIQIPVDAKGGETATLALSVIRDAIESHSKSAGGEINIGRISIAGSVCNIRIIREDPEPGLSASQASVNKDSDRNMAVEHSEAGTLRASIESKILSMAGVTLDKLKLIFDQRDDEILRTSTIHRSVVILPGGGGERIPLQLRVYESGHLILSSTIRVEVMVLRQVAIAKEPINRGTILSADILDIQEQWLPMTATAAAADNAIGMTLRSRIGAGEIIEQKDLEASIAVKKGDLVTLVSLTGDLEIRTTGRALASAKEGDVILFETLEWKSRVSGRVSRPGLVTVIGPAQAESSRKSDVLSRSKK